MADSSGPFDVVYWLRNDDYSKPRGRQSCQSREAADAFVLGVEVADGDFGADAVVYGSKRWGLMVANPEIDMGAAEAMVAKAAL